MSSVSISRMTVIVLSKMPSPVRGRAPRDNTPPPARSQMPGSALPAGAGAAYDARPIPSANGRPMTDISHYIDGKRVAGKGARGGDVFNPATGERVRRVAFASAAEINAAVQSAAKAFPGWAATPPLTRARILFKFLELLAREHENLARVISEEHGKVFSDAHGEVTRGVEVVEFA